jgi:hypothetical protein
MINVRDIQKIEDARKQVRKDIYKKILEQFSRKIQVSVSANQKQVFLQVPEFLLGYPSYDIEVAATYLKRQLENGGFKVVSVSSTSFNVSWHKEREQREPARVSFEPAPPTFSEEYFPSLINLKKAAKRYG